MNESMDVSAQGNGTASGPLVSVIIPTYNRAEYVVEAVASVSQQTYTNLEIIVIDDGSSDDTPECLEPLLKDSRIRYLRQDNAGPAAARNKGLDAVTGEFVAFLDSDDLWLPDSVENRVRAFQKLPESVGVLFADYVRELSRGETKDETFLESAGYDELFRSTHSLPEEGSESCRVMNEAFRELQAVQCVINTPTTMIRRSVLGDLHFDPFFRACQDWDFFTRVSLRTSVACLLRKTARVRFWIAGTTSDGMRQTHFERILMRRHLKYFSRRGVRLRIRRRIASISYARAYGSYRRNQRADCLADCMLALFWGHSPSRTLALFAMALLPRAVRDRVRQANPWQGRPVE